MRIFRKLAQMLDVEIVNPVDNDRLQYETATGKWKNTSVSGVAPHHGSHEEGGDDEVSVTVGMMDAEASTDGQVPTSDGAGGVTWEDQAGGGGGAPTDVDYLVGTASAGLSAEIVVGTSPGGELGGTWASPTVDATHSGSSHASVQAAAEATAASELSTHASDTTGVHGIADTSSLVLTGDSRLTDSRTPTGAAGGVLGGTYPNPSFASDMATQAELDAHVNDTSAAHAASAVSADSTTLVGTGTDVQAVLEELDNGIADHLADTTAAHAASAISYAGNTSLSSTDVEAALDELDNEKQPLDSDLTAFAALAPSNDDIVQRKAGAWTNRTIAQLLTDLAAAGTTFQPLDSDLTTIAGLGDPNADRILFWDDSAGAFAYLTAGTGLSISGTSITATGGGGGGSMTQVVPVRLTNPQISANAGNSFYTVLGLTDWDAGHWEFVKDVDGKAYGLCRVPAAYSSGGTLKLAIAANATSGATRLGVGTKAVADGESLNPTLTDETKQDITVPGTAYLQKVVSFSLTETLAAGDTLLVEVFHEGSHANDTLAVNTLLLDAWLEVTVTT